MKLDENAMKLTNENNFTGNEFRMIPYGKGYEKAMKFGVTNEILTFHGFSCMISLAFIGYPSSSETGSSFLKIFKFINTVRCVRRPYCCCIV